MSGIELAEYARGRFPKMNVIIISGQPVNPLPARATFLHKPFPATRLIEAVRGNDGASFAV
jgi:FixJ family two-component response regulator